MSGVKNLLVRANESNDIAENDWHLGCMLTGFTTCLGGSDCFLDSITGAPLWRVRPPTTTAAAAAAAADDDDDDDDVVCAARRVRPSTGTLWRVLGRTAMARELAALLGASIPRTVAEGIVPCRQHKYTHTPTRTHTYYTTSRQKFCWAAEPHRSVKHFAIYITTDYRLQTVQATSEITFI